MDANFIGYLPSNCSTLTGRGALSRVSLNNNLPAESGSLRRQQEVYRLSIWDLHCHTTASDGELTPLQLYQRAAGRGVTHLAITDHDSVEGVRSLREKIESGLDIDSSVESIHPPPELINGVEITACDGEQVVHVVGLWLDIDADPLREFLRGQQRFREQRGQAISDRLEEKGLPPTFHGAMAHAEGSALGRPHFARYMEELGVVDNIGHAFKRWLGRGKPGDIDIDWPEMSRAIEMIHSSGGFAVLAHPYKYNLRYGKIFAMCERFKEMGGDAIEVVTGAQGVKELRDLKRIAERLELAASTGSDFHSPKQTWCDLGTQPALPDSCVPVWMLCEQRPKLTSGGTQ